MTSISSLQSSSSVSDAVDSMVLEAEGGIDAHFARVGRLLSSDAPVVVNGIPATVRLCLPNNTPLQVHPAILQASSGLCARYLAEHNPPLELEFSPNEITSLGLRKAIEFACEGQVMIDPQSVGQLLQAANVLQMADLLQSCQNYLEKKEIESTKQPNTWQSEEHHRDDSDSPEDMIAAGITKLLRTNRVSAEDRQILKAFVDARAKAAARKSAPTKRIQDQFGCLEVPKRTPQAGRSSNATPAESDRSHRPEARLTPLNSPAGTELVSNDEKLEEELKVEAELEKGKEAEEWPHTRMDVSYPGNYPANKLAMGKLATSPRMSRKFFGSEVPRMFET